MAFRKRQFKRRPTRRHAVHRRRRVAPVRRRRLPRRGRLARRSGQSLNVKFVTVRPDIAVSANTTSVIRDSTQLNQYSGFNNWRSLYRRYKLNRIKVTYIPRWNTGTVANGAGGYAFTFDTRFTDRAVVETLDEALNASHSRRRNFYKPFSVYYKPTITNIVNSIQASTTSLASIPMLSPWLDTQEDITHYGHGALLVAQGTGLTWEVIKTMYVSFRDRVV